jgi:hypothetical protein
MDKELKIMARQQERALRRLEGLWPATAAFVGAMVLAIYVRIFMSCMCGFVDLSGLLLSGLALAIGWRAFIRFQPLNFFTSLFRVLVVGSISLLFLHAVADVLWLGHNAPFQWPFRLRR